MNLDDLATYSDLASLSGLSLAWVYQRMREKGAPEPVKTYGTTKLYDKKEALEFLRRKR